MEEQRFQDKETSFGEPIPPNDGDQAVMRIRHNPIVYSLSDFDYLQRVDVLTGTYDQDLELPLDGTSWPILGHIPPEPPMKGFGGISSGNAYWAFSPVLEFLLYLGFFPFKDLPDGSRVFQPNGDVGLGIIGFQECSKILNFHSISRYGGSWNYPISVEMAYLALGFNPTTARMAEKVFRLQCECFCYGELHSLLREKLGKMRDGLPSIPPRVESNGKKVWMVEDQED